MNRLIQIKRSTAPLFVLIMLACFGLLPQARAGSPTLAMLPAPPDGCYPNFTTAEGCDALRFLTSGTGNTAVGWRSLFSDTTGDFNTGVGGGALVLNNGESNTAVGAAALLLNSTGNQNTALGTDALVFNDNGSDNNAVGAFALFNNTTGDENTAVGGSALTNSTGNENTALGFEAGMLATDGDGNVYIGAGMSGVAGESNHTYVRNIKDTPLGPPADDVTVDLTTGLLGHASSSRRYKEDIKPMNKASEALYRLNPVTYRYKKEIDRKQSPAFGLLAEEVAAVNPNLVTHNSQGQPESVHYEMVNAMLLNEFLKEHHLVQEQGAMIARQQKQIEALTAGLQKVSAQLELNKSAPQTVLNNQ